MNGAPTERETPTWKSTRLGIFTDIGTIHTAVATQYEEGHGLVRHTYFIPPTRPDTVN